MTIDPDLPVGFLMQEVVKTAVSRLGANTENAEGAPVGHQANITRYSGEVQVWNQVATDLAGHALTVFREVMSGRNHTEEAIAKVMGDDGAEAWVTPVTTTLVVNGTPYDAVEVSHGTIGALVRAAVVEGRWTVIVTVPFGADPQVYLTWVTGRPLSASE